MGLRNLILSGFWQKVIKEHPGLIGKDAVMPSQLQESGLLWASTVRTLVLVSMLLIALWPPPCSPFYYCLPFLSRPVSTEAPWHQGGQGLCWEESRSHPAGGEPEAIWSWALRHDYEGPVLPPVPGSCLPVLRAELEEPRL